MRGGDVEKYQFVGAFIGVAPTQFDRVAGVAQVYKIDAFDRAAVFDIETGNDAFGKHGRVGRV